MTDELTTQNNEQPTVDFEHYYMNRVQLLANIIDPNMLYAEWARATGKTEGVIVPRLIRVTNDMPGELSFLVHKTYVALMTNVWPNIQASFSRPVIVNGKQCWSMVSTTWWAKQSYPLTSVDHATLLHTLSTRLSFAMVHTFSWYLQISLKVSQVVMPSTHSSRR